MFGTMWVLDSFNNIHQRWWKFYGFAINTTDNYGLAVPFDVTEATKLKPP